MSRVRILGCAAVCAVMCCGCVVPYQLITKPYEDEVDISTVPNAENVAVISTSMGTVVLVSWDCWISHPVNAKRVIIDPGYVSINISCDSPGDGQGPSSRGYYFEAIAGHTYKHSVDWSCRRIVDTTDDQTIVEDCD